MLIHNLKRSLPELIEATLTSAARQGQQPVLWKKETAIQRDVAASCFYLPARPDGIVIKEFSWGIHDLLWDGVNVTHYYDFDSSTYFVCLKLCYLSDRFKCQWKNTSSKLYVAIIITRKYK